MSKPAVKLIKAEILDYIVKRLKSGAFLSFLVGIYRPIKVDTYARQAEIPGYRLDQTKRVKVKEVMHKRITTKLHEN